MMTKAIDWPCVSLKQISTKIGSGATPRGGENSYKTSGIPLIRSLNIFNFRFEYNKLAYIDNEQAANLSNVEVFQNDILLNITGASVARCCIVPPSIPPARVNQHVSIVRIDTGRADPYYVLNVINSPYYKYKLLTLAQGGATREALTKEKIENFEIPLPPLPTQRKIAAILSAYDDLIENNTRRIQILEQMAQALYREWFVEFRFPGHEGKQIIETEAGFVPREWERSQLKYFISLDKGISYTGKGLTPDGLPMINLKCFLPDGGFRREGIKPYSGDYKNSQTVMPGDIVIANTDLTQAGNIVGSPALVPHLCISNDILFTHHVYAIRFIYPKRLSKYFLYSLLKTDDFRGFARGRANGTTVLGLPRDGILDYSFILPTEEILVRFDDVVRPMYTLMEILLDENDIMRQQRDLLLPRLVSGELDVSDLEIANLPEP